MLACLLPLFDLLDVHYDANTVIRHTHFQVAS